MDNPYRRYRCVIRTLVGFYLGLSLSSLTEESAAQQPDDVPGPIRRLEDKSPSVTTVIDASTKIGQPAVPALITALQDGQPRVRWDAATALGRMGSSARKAVP